MNSQNASPQSRARACVTKFPVTRLPPMKGSMQCPMAGGNLCLQGCTFLACVATNTRVAFHRKHRSRLARKHWSMLALQGRLLHSQVSAATSAPLPIPANQVLTGFPTQLPVSKSPPAPPHKPPVCPGKSKEPPLHTCKPSLHPGSPPQSPIQCW